MLMRCRWNIFSAKNRDDWRAETDCFMRLETTIFRSRQTLDFRESQVSPFVSNAADDQSMLRSAMSQNIPIRPAHIEDGVTEGRLQLQKAARPTFN